MALGGVGYNLSERTTSIIVIGLHSVFYPLKKAMVPRSKDIRYASRDISIYHIHTFYLPPIID